MKVLVTGGAGYIGIPLCRQLIERGHTVIVYDRLFWGKESLAVEFDPNHNPNIEVIQGDIRQLDSGFAPNIYAPDLLQNIDAICHLAGLSNDPTAEYNPEANYQMNVVATQKLVEWAKGQGIKRFTFASSASVYDREVDQSDLHTIPAMCDESTLVVPRGHYSITKKQAEDVILQATDSSFAPVILRQGTVYGYAPRMRLDLVVNTFLKDALIRKQLFLHGGGWMWRPLVDIEDVARAHVEALEADLNKIGGQIFNIVEENYQIRQLAMIVAGSLSITHPYEEASPVKIVEAPAPKLLRNYRMTGAKASNILGFTPQRTVMMSVADMITKDIFKEQNREGLGDPQYYNIRWMSLLEEVHNLQAKFGSIY